MTVRRAKGLMGAAWMGMQIRIWQAMCVLCPVVPPPDTASTLQKIFAVLQVQPPAPEASLCSQWQSSRARCMPQPSEEAPPGIVLHPSQDGAEVHVLVTRCPVSCPPTFGVDTAQSGELATHCFCRMLLLHPMPLRGVGRA